MNLLICGCGTTTAIASTDGSGSRPVPIAATNTYDFTNDCATAPNDAQNAFPV